MAKVATLGESNLLRIHQIIGDPDRGIEPLIPVKRTSWYAGIKRGDYPKPVRIGPRLVAWRSSDIRKLVEQQPEQPAAA
jgi:predicted DNA-binding transcriptional regulator AlpA